MILQTIQFKVEKFFFTFNQGTNLVAHHAFLVGSTACSTQRNWGAHSSLNTFLIFAFFFSMVVFQK
jgi:hypothetical protein